MKALLVIASLLICTACTSMKPVQRSPHSLPEQIIQDNLIQPGNRVNIETTDGKYHEFQVTEVTSERISGDTTEIAIADVVAVQILEATTLGKAVVGTAVLAMSVAFWAAVSALIAAVVTLGL